VDLGADGQARTGFSGTIHAGAEYWYDGLLALRAGMMGRDLTFGAGVRYRKVGPTTPPSSIASSAPTFRLHGSSSLDVTHGFRLLRLLDVRRWGAGRRPGPRRGEGTDARTMGVFLAGGRAEGSGS